VLAREAVTPISAPTGPIPLWRAASGDLVVRRLYDQLELVRLTAAGSRVRVPANADCTQWPFIAIYALTSAELITAGSQSIVLSEGDCYVLRNHTTTRLDVAGPAELLVISLPTDAIGLYRRTFDDADGCRCATHQGTASLVGHLLDAMASQLEGYEPANPARLAQHVVGLLALMWSDTLTAELGWSRSKLLERSKEFIEAHLSDIDLTPDRIAAAQHMSARNLHRLFESEGLTIGGWIRYRRLEHCRVDLVDGALKDVAVSHIAARWGLWEAAHFSRLFKATYGLSPRSYRVAYQSIGDNGHSTIIRERLNQPAFS
jgi:AraC-like DNA-binding protein